MPKKKSKRGRPPITKKSSAKRGPDAKRTRHTGVIRADEILTIDAFCERFKITRNHVNKMRDEGLVVRMESEKNLRILGSDYIEFVKSLPVAPIRGDDAGEDEEATP